MVSKTISEVIHQQLLLTCQLRFKRLVEINAPKVIIDNQQKLIDNHLTGKFKLPGAVRGGFKKYLDEPFTIGFIINDDTSKLKRFYKIEGDDKYLVLQRNRWKSLEFSTTYLLNPNDNRNYIKIELEDLFSETLK